MYRRREFEIEKSLATADGLSLLTVMVVRTWQNEAIRLTGFLVLSERTKNK